MMSTPNLALKRRSSGDGSASPADAASRTEENVWSGRSLARRAAKNVGTPKKSVGRCCARLSPITCGVGRRDSRIVVAPTENGKKTVLPMP